MQHSGLTRHDGLVGERCRTGLQTAYAIPRTTSKHLFPSPHTSLSVQGTDAAQRNAGIGVPCISAVHEGFTADGRRIGRTSTACCGHVKAAPCINKDSIATTTTTIAAQRAHTAAPCEKVQAAAKVALASLGEREG